MSVTAQLTAAVAGLLEILKVVDSIQDLRFRFLIHTGDHTGDYSGEFTGDYVGAFIEDFDREIGPELLEIGERILFARRSVAKYRLLYPNASITEWTRPEWVLTECEVWWRYAKQAYQRNNCGYHWYKVPFLTDIEDWKEDIREVARTLVRNELPNSCASEQQRIIDEASLQARVPASVHLIQLGISKEEKLPPCLKEHQVELVRAAIKVFGPRATQANIIKHIRSVGGKITDTTLREILDYLYERGEYMVRRRKKGSTSKVSQFGGEEGKVSAKGQGSNLVAHEDAGAAVGAFQSAYRAARPI